MVEDITKLIYDYTNRGQIVDSKYISQVIYIYFNNNDIKGFLKKVYFKDPDNEDMAAYDPGEKVISIDIARIIYNSMELFDKEKISNNYYELVLKINLYITKAIIHELNHVKQFKTIYSDNNSFSKELYILSFNSDLLVLNNNYEIDMVSDNIVKYVELSSNNYLDNKFYTSMPAERMAEINALKLCRDIAINLESKETERVVAYESLKYRLVQQLAYNTYAPTPYFVYRDNLIKKESGLIYDSINIDEISSYFEKKSIDSNYSLDEKLYYGLPILPVEKDIHKERIKKYESILFR